MDRSTSGDPVSCSRGRRRPSGALPVLAALSTVLCGVLEAQLEDLIRIKPGRSRRVSSTAAVDPSNRDNVQVKPGETHVVADLTGPGVIRHMWLTFADAAPGWLAKDGAADPSEIVLRMYWDGAPEPAVEAPFGDFFAAGFGKRAEVASVPVQVQGGDSYNCFWAMPFFTRARITLTNESAKPLAALYYHVDWTEESLPADTARFCAQYRREFPTVLDRDYLILDAVGTGHFTGCVLSVRSRSPEWFGEGDEKMTIDGEARPSIRGTGTEDWFLNAWGLERGSFPYFGVTVLEGDWGTPGQKFCAYRWNIADPVRFTKSLRVELEHYGWLSADETSTGKIEGFVEREDDFASVAFWYQKGRPKRFAPIPPLAERRWPEIDAITTGEALLAAAQAEGGGCELQGGHQWTGSGQVLFNGDAVKGVLETSFTAATSDLRRLVVSLTHSYDFGIYQVSLDGEPLGGPIDLHSAAINVREHHFGDRRLTPGRHTLRFECVGRNPASTGFKMGLDSVRLRERWLKKRVPR